MKWYTISSPCWLYSALTKREVYVKLCNNVVYVAYNSKKKLTVFEKSPFADQRDRRLIAPEQ